MKQTVNNLKHFLGKKVLCVTEKFIKIGTLDQVRFENNVVGVLLDNGGYMWSDYPNAEIYPILGCHDEYIKDYPRTDYTPDWMSKNVPRHMNIRDFFNLFDKFRRGAVKYDKSPTGYCDLISYHRGLYFPCVTPKQVEEGGET